MKKYTVLILLGLFGSLGLLGRAQKPASKSAAESMVETERAFAKMSEDQGTRPAFVAFIAEDGVIFRPTAVVGSKWFKEHPLPASEKRPLLSWYPSVADVSLAGDMGYSTGPWEFKSDNHDAESVAWGTFLTIWKKQADGSWRFAIDLGISNPKPEQAAAPWQASGKLQPRNGFGPGSDKNAGTLALLARDGEFSKASETVGARKSFPDFALAEVRVYREGKFPGIGRETGTALLPEPSSVWTWIPAAGDVSISNDLGYTYGSYKIMSGDKVAESGNYMRIWKKDGGKWKILFDLTNPIPPPKKD